MADENMSGKQWGCGCGARQGQGRPHLCVCPACGEKAPHRPGTPCREMACPKCGGMMCRELPAGGPVA